MKAMSEFLKKEHPNNMDGLQAPPRPPSTKHFNLNSGHTFNGEHSKLGSKLNTKTHA